MKQVIAVWALQRLVDGKIEAVAPKTVFVTQSEAEYNDFKAAGAIVDDVNAAEAAPAAPAAPIPGDTNGDGVVDAADKKKRGRPAAAKPAAPAADEDLI